MTEKYSVFAYQYRDAGNYKAQGRLLLLGSSGSAFDEAIYSSCCDRHYFVAEQVGIPPLYEELYTYSNGPTTDDIAFHEFHEFCHATPEDIQTLQPWGALNKLVSRFLAIQAWDCSLSPHCL